MTTTELPHLDERQREIVQRVRSWSSQAMIAVCLVIYVAVPFADWLDTRTAVLIVAGVALLTEFLGLWRLHAHVELREINAARHAQPLNMAVMMAILFFVMALSSGLEDGPPGWSIVWRALVAALFGGGVGYLTLRTMQRQERRHARERAQTGETLDHERGRKVGEAIARWFGIGGREHGPR